MSNQPASTFSSNVDLYLKNIIALKELRPKTLISFKENPNSIFVENKGVPLTEEALDQLCALNTSIVLNSFALFEACFERQLLSSLNTGSLSGIQEKIVDKYIDDVIKLSSIGKYEREFAFIKSQRLSDFLTADENEKLKTIKIFTVLRNLLIHGSTSMQVLEMDGNTGKFANDPTDKEYLELVRFLIKTLQLTVSEYRMNLRMLLYLNNATDLLVDAVFHVSNALLTGTKHGQFRKENPFTSMPEQSGNSHP